MTIILEEQVTWKLIRRMEKEEINDYLASRRRGVVGFEIRRSSYTWVVICSRPGKNM